MTRPCPCDRASAGVPFDGARDCFPCWLWHNKPERFGRVAAAPVAPAVCPHRGAPTGETVGCRTCRGTLRLPVLACSAYGACVEGDRAPASDAVKACRWCSENPANQKPKAVEPLAGPGPRRLIEVPQEGLATGGTGAINASRIRYQGRPLMAYRAGVNRASIHVAEYAADGRLIRSVPLALRHPRGSASQEDPRLAVRPDGGLRVWFYGYERGHGGRTTQLYADLSDDLKAGPVWEPQLHGRTYPKEKNWSPFVHAGEQYVVYTVSPHVIVRIDGDRAERVHVSDTPFPWSGGHLRGGAPPVLVGDRFYHWFHGATETPEGLHYNVGAYAFEAKPPFRPIAMTPHPLLWGSRHDNVTRDKCPYHAVAFPCGAYLEGGVWYVSMGWNDRRIKVAEWDAATVNAALQT